MLKSGDIFYHSSSPSTESDSFTENNRSIDTVSKLFSSLLKTSETASNTECKSASNTILQNDTQSTSEQCPINDLKCNDDKKKKLSPTCQNSCDLILKSTSPVTGPDENKAFKIKRSLAASSETVIIDREKDSCTPCNNSKIPVLHTKSDSFDYYSEDTKKHQHNSEPKLIDTNNLKRICSTSKIPVCVRRTFKLQSPLNNFDRFTPWGDNFAVRRQPYQEKEMSRRNNDKCPPTPSGGKYTHIKSKLAPYINRPMKKDCLRDVRSKSPSEKYLRNDNAYSNFSTMKRMNSRTSLETYTCDYKMPSLDFNCSDCKSEDGTQNYRKAREHFELAIEHNRIKMENERIICEHRKIISKHRQLTVEHEEKANEHILKAISYVLNRITVRFAVVKWNWNSSSNRSRIFGELRDTWFCGVLDGGFRHPILQPQKLRDGYITVNAIAYSALEVEEVEGNDKFNLHLHDSKHTRNNSPLAVCFVQFASLMEEESLEERQLNEIHALKAIFTDQFVNCNENIAEWRPLDVILTVFPQRERSGPLEAHVQVDLHIIACNKYPTKVPVIRLEKSKGLSDKLLAEMQKKLEELALSKVGEVMIFELVQYVQTVLTECNKPAFQSFYEEMLSRQKIEKQNRKERQQTEENIKRQLIRLEVQGIKEERQRNKKTRTQKYEEESNDDDNIPSDMIQRKSLVEENLKPRHHEEGKGDIKHGIESPEKNFNTISMLNYNSRLLRDFDILGFIGEGAYGDVLKVRHKFDTCLYAIKRIKLIHKNTSINKKIMREVKLLSSLNHENVVRYYNSWVEDILKNKGSDSEGEPSLKDYEKYDELPLSENLNLIFHYPKGMPSFSDDDEEEEDEIDWIEFKQNDDEGTDVPDSANSMSPDLNDSKLEFLPNQCMYIQMEYCEKSTLRSAIDDDLYLDESRVWRLLREVVEGLAYIHLQGIIHRDLKPVNLFIDSNDHVKIGDFGLATPNKPGCIAVQRNANLLNFNDLNMESADASYTGQIGTALYAAPELSTGALNIRYNQKVDVYSLGIIFFEMCYPPFHTGMERTKILTNLRSKSRNFPDNFYDPKYTRQIKLIRELLDHNPAERPTASEILKRDYLPSAEVGDEKFYETVRDTLRNPQCKAYKHLIAECFDQKISIAEDLTFDEHSPHVKLAWQHVSIEKLADKARKVFRLHGAMYFSAPILSPNNGVANVDGGVVSLMTRSGNVMNLPYDLRLAFARYLAQNPDVTHTKRYTIEKVFRERRILGMHPKEVYECSLDIVGTSCGNLVMETEILGVVCQYLDSISDSLQKNCVMRLNHVGLVSAVLCHHHIVTKKHADVCYLLNKIRFQTSPNLSKTNIRDFQKLGISDIANIINVLNVELSPQKLSSHFANYMKKTTASANACRLAVNQLETIIRNLAYLNVKCPIVIAPSVITNFHHYSGLIFQVVLERKNKSQLERDVVAVGGRYDSLILLYREALKISKKTKQSAVGLSIFLDKLIGSLMIKYQFFSTVDVVVCSIGKKDLTQEKLNLLRELWNAEIRSTSLDVEQSLEETQDYCEKMKIPHIVFIKESEPGIARLRSYYKERFHEKKLSLSEIVPYLHRVVNQPSNNNVEAVNNNNYTYSRSESRSASVSVNENRSVNITYIFDEKMVTNTRRRYDNQISNVIANAVQKISSKVKIEVLALNVEYDLVKALVSSVEPRGSDDSYLAPLIKKFPRHKKCLHRIADTLDDLLSRDPVPVIIFFSVQDNNFRISI